MKLLVVDRFKCQIWGIRTLPADGNLAPPAPKKIENGADRTLFRVDGHARVAACQSINRHWNKPGGCDLAKADP